ncbi:MAG: adenosylmethionine decarboxylase [Alteromonadaceae bacterium]|nr:adenosylmethionine decarboxylase [Alteromonadaceae bacterium]
MSKLKLHGFNNLTKTLGLCVYQLRYTNSLDTLHTYNQFINQQYKASRLNHILAKTADIIGGNILNSASQDYQPQGASVTMMIAEGDEGNLIENIKQPINYLASNATSVVNHLDKSHICIHTYPETQAVNGISIFRADIEISTCGVISPLRAANFFISTFNPDITTLDYRVRGVTRDTAGIKHYLDEKITSIQGYLSEDIKHKHYCSDINLPKANIFMTKVKRKEFELENYLFARKAKDYSTIEQKHITKLVKREIEDIFASENG